MGSPGQQAPYPRSSAREEARKVLVREFLVESGDRTLPYDPKAFRDDHFPSIGALVTTQWMNS